MLRNRRKRMRSLLSHKRDSVLANKKSRPSRKKSKRKSASASLRRSNGRRRRKRIRLLGNRPVSRRELSVRMRKSVSALKKRKNDWHLKMNV